MFLPKKIPEKLIAWHLPYGLSNNENAEKASRKSERFLRGGRWDSNPRPSEPQSVTLTD